MRRAELVMALALAAFSVYLMWKSYELPVGWITDEGPGGGAFPFWLSAAMLGSCCWIVVRWFRRSSVPSRSKEPYMTQPAVVLFVAVAGSLALMIGAIHVIGVYFSVPLFLVFYLRVLGQHSWMKTAFISLATPVVTFFFFEVLLLITLPKGFSEPLFYPLYDWFL